MIRLLKELQQHPVHTQLVVSRISEGRAWHQGTQGVTRNTLVCQPVPRARPGARGAPSHDGSLEGPGDARPTQWHSLASHSRSVLSSQVVKSGEFKAFDYGSKNRAVYQQVGAAGAEGWGRDRVACRD